MIRPWKIGLHMLLVTLMTGVFAAATYPRNAEAANPSTMSFQGKVVNSDGTNVANGTYSFVFKLYTASSSGSAIWTETQSSVTVNSGVFHASLGSVCPFFTANICNGNTPIDFNSNSSLYLGVTFNSDPAGEMSPRVQLQSVPFAFNSDRVGGLTVNQLVQLNPSVTQAGSIDIDGDVFSGGEVQGVTLTATGALQGNTLSVNSGSFAVTSAGAVTGGTYNGATLSGTELTGSGALVITAGGTNQSLTVNASGSGQVLIGGVSTGNILLGGGSGSTGCTLTNSTGAFACTSTINGATISGGSLSGTALTGTGAFSVTAGGTNQNLTLNGTGSGTVNIGSTSTGDILLGGGSGSTGCTLTNSTGAFACTSTITGSAFAGSSALSISAGGSAQNLSLDASTSGQINIGATSTGSINFAGGAGSTGCTITATGNLTCDGTYNSNTFTSSALTFGAAGAASIQAASTQALTVDSGTTGALSIGTGASAKTITIGNSTGATSVAVSCGTGLCSFGANATDHTTTIGSNTGASSTVIQAGSAGISLGSSTTVTGSLSATASLTSNLGGTAQVSLGTLLGAPIIAFGTGTDAWLFRPSSGTLQTNASFTSAGVSTTSLSASTNIYATGWINGAGGITSASTISTTSQFTVDSSVYGLKVNRSDNPTSGNLVGFFSNNVLVGTISCAGTGSPNCQNVTYNAFTGSHYALPREGDIQSGTLVELTGNNARYQNLADTEIIYGVRSVAAANSPNVFGTYLGVMESNDPMSVSNPALVSAAGNGDVWVVDNGKGDLKIGDNLLSSSLPGYAMKDPGVYATAHVFAKVAENIDWSSVTANVGGAKVAKVSVLYSYFDKDRPSWAAIETNDLALSLNAEGVTIAPEGQRTVISGDLMVKAETAFNGAVKMDFKGSDSLSITSDLKADTAGINFTATPTDTDHDTTGLFVKQAAGAGTNGLDAGIRIDNENSTTEIGAALQIDNTGGGGYRNLIGSSNFNVTGAGDVTANGSVTARNSLQILDANSQQLFTIDSGGGANLAGALNAASVTLSGGLTVGGDANFAGLTTFQKLATFIGKTIFRQDVEFEGNITVAKDTAGYAKIRPGESSVRVNFTSPYQDAPVVSASISNGQFAQISINNVNATGFDIELSDPAAAEINLNWTALSVRDARTITNPPTQ